ncbi:hypothetical protein FRC03_001161 [Tulasnella sp. 419]|nr:hypothetical protein FRC02_000155 [Tulasnella sp. 418]KAG8964937.1 hypothetical protein FRC03_001161 [Tulasnella sp. 419]
MWIPAICIWAFLASLSVSTVVGKEHRDLKPRNAFQNPSNARLRPRINRYGTRHTSGSFAGKLVSLGKKVFGRVTEATDKKRDPKLGPGPGYAKSRALLQQLRGKQLESADAPVLGKRQTNLASSATPTSTGAQPTASANSSEPDLSGVWILDDYYDGRNFFDYWYFWNHPDATHGLVEYVDRDTAFKESLSYVRSDGRIIMRADNTTVLSPGQNRKSVRIESEKSYTGGLFILDIDRAPHGCGIWPAFWTSNGNWPYDGEIDVYEGVHESTNNQVAWHTDAGCTLKPTGNFTGHVKSTDCNGLIANNVGCTIDDASSSSSGRTLNVLGGGVYAMKWDETGISVWFFPHSVIPEDITNFTPDPTRWGLPSAHLSPEDCDIVSHFRDHKIIFNITFCGDWAGPSYGPSGCPGQCADRIADPANFNEAYWVINNLRVYTNSKLEAGILNDAPRRMRHGRWNVVFSLAALMVSMYI